MFQTAFTLALTQFARSLSLPERLQRAPARNLALEALRLRNTALDALHYDIKVITPQEAFYISDSLAAEGTIMIVPPSGTGSLALCDTVEEFVLRGGPDVRALAVAGVGGSALGAAAFARNVADAIGAPVAAVISGYGLADIVTEAFGGHFFFGHLRGVRPIFEALDDAAGRQKFGVSEDAADPGHSRTSLDTRTIRALLADPRLSLDLLAGHSKGALVLSAALHDLEKRDPARAASLARRTRIVTFGSRIAMPPVFTDVTDIIGAWDWFGEMNSRSFIKTDRRVPDAGHHTNTDLPNHLPVTRILRELAATAGPVAAVAPVATETADPATAKPPAVSKPARKPPAKRARIAPTPDILSKVAALETARERGPERTKPH